MKVTCHTTPANVPACSTGNTCHSTTGHVNTCHTADEPIQRRAEIPSRRTAGSQGRPAARWIRLILPCLFWLGSVTGLRAESIEGFTEPFQTIDVAASEVGIITKVHVTQGATVAAGALLAELDTDVLVSTLEIAQAKASAQGASEAAIAERDLRQKRLTQLEKLMTKGHATSGELSRAQADLAITEARVKMAAEEQKMAELDCRRIQSQIERRRIRSPISGLVAEVHRDAGEAFLTNDPRVVTLVNIDQLRVRFQVMPHQALAFTEGDKVTLTLPDVQKDVTAQIERISPIMDAKSGTVEVSVLLDNRTLKLRSGTRCTIEVAKSERTRNAQPNLPTRSVTREK